jgi:hypothetical protein
LDPDPHPDAKKRLDPDPQNPNADPHHFFRVAEQPPLFRQLQLFLVWQLQRVLREKKKRKKKKLN